MPVAMFNSSAFGKSYSDLINSSKISCNMENDFQDINQVVAATGDAVTELTDLMAAVDTIKVNHVPFEGSWTAPQLLRHVSKSIAGMAIALPNPGKSADRNNAERVQELR